MEIKQERFKERLNTILYSALASPFFIYGLYCIITKQGINFGAITNGAVYGANAVGVGLVYIGIAGILFFGLALKDHETRRLFIFRALGVSVAALCILTGILYFGFL